MAHRWYRFYWGFSLVTAAFLLSRCRARSGFGLAVTRPPGSALYRAG